MSDKKIEISSFEAEGYMYAAEHAWDMLYGIREYGCIPTYEQITEVLQKLEKISNGIYEATKKGE